MNQTTTLIPTACHTCLKRTRAFTLVELLIVIGVIGILISIVLTIGARVAQGGKVRLTEQTIRVLDMTLESLIADQGVLPPAYVADPRFAPQGGQTPMIPIADARDFSESYSSGQPGQPVLAGHQMINSVGLFLLQTQSAPGAAEVAKGIDSRLIRRFDPDYSDDVFGAAGGGHQPTLPTVFDAWNRPIRYVHPQFDGFIFGPNYSQGIVTNPAAAVALQDVMNPINPNHLFSIQMIRRNASATTSGGGPANRLPDSDGGRCQSNSPYFYSAGPDGDPSTTSDNVYTTAPILPQT